MHRSPFGMTPRLLWSVYLVVFAVLVAGAVTLLAIRGAEAQTEPPADPLDKVLVFSKTVGFRHSSIDEGIASIRQLGTENGFAVDATEDSAQFTDENLAQYDAVVWLSTTSDVLNNDQQAAFERYIRGGGGYVGIHAAADTEYGWGWYGQLVGGYFKSHPPGTPQATVKVEDRTNPSTSHLPADWVRTDEWYNYQSPTSPVVNGNQPGIPDYSPRNSGVKVLATVDENTYDEQDDSAAADDHPIAWCSEFDGGRSFYTGGGHTEASFVEDDFEKHLLGGIRWAGGAVDANCGEPRKAPPSDNDFEQQTLAKGTILGEPIAMAVLPNGDVLSTDRRGAVSLTTLGGVTTKAAQVPVYAYREDGLQGIAIDPNFEQNQWVYLFYAPPLNTPPDTAAPDTSNDPNAWDRFKGYNRLSRVKFENGQLNLSTEQEILRVEADRGDCCHVGGEIDFDADGNLYLSTGDNTDPFQSDGFTPIDERPTRNPMFDAQRSSANTNDLRGKLLRIKVQDDPATADKAEYTVPAGNLYGPNGKYPAVEGKTRPEIYAMGFRNPFRFAVDKETGWVHLGDYGPDAGAADPNRGPGGQVEFNLIKGAGNYGWPYCHGNNDAYNDYNFATGQSGAKFNCAAPVNESPRNTGLRELPPVEPAWIAYDNGSVPEFGSGSESPMGGPVYNFDPNLQSDVKFPEYYDGKTFAYEFGRRWIKAIGVGPNGERGKIEPFFDSMQRTQLINIEFGPDGSLYVLDYGTGFFTGDANSAVYKVNYVKGSRSPVAVATADKDSGLAPLTVQFSSQGSKDPDNDPITYSWDFDGDGTADSTEQNPTHTYEQNGTYNALLTVKDSSGKTGTSQVVINVGNSRPDIKVELPVNGDFFDYGETVPYRVTGTDAEDGEIDCAEVKVDTALGHAEHSHGDQAFTGCEGTITIPQAWEPKDQESFYVVTASYTDNGGTNGAPPIRDTDQAILQTRTMQAEHFVAQQGTQTVDQFNASGGRRVGYIDNGDWLAFEPINLSNTESVTARVSSGGSGGDIELRWNAPDGPVAGTINVPNTGGWDNYVTLQPAELQNVPNGTGRLYMEFSGGFDVDEFTFNKIPDPNQPRASIASATPKQGEAPLTVNFDGQATDPNGDALTYAWDFQNDGVVDATTEDASYTYEDPGKYTAKFTATDAGGLSKSVSTTINVFPPAAPCETPQSDQFNDTSLDKTRWNAIVREDAANYRVEDGSLVLPTTRSDIYGGSNGAPNLILQDLPEGPWTATTKMDFNPTANYQKAGLLIYGDDDNWLSSNLVFAASKRFEFIRETNGNARNDFAAGDQKEVPANFPSNYWVRMTSDGNTVTASYSVDNQTWVPFGRPATLEGIQNPKIGLFAVRSEQDSAQINANFDSFTLVGPSDEFDGTGLMACRWTDIVREVPGNYRVANGALKISTGNGKDMYGGNTTAENLILQPAPGDAWEATTKMALNFTGKDYEQAGMMVYGNDQNFAKLSYIKVPNGRQLEFIQQQNGSPVDGGAQDRTELFGNDVPSELFLRITSDGTNLRASYSVDGTTFTDFGRARPLSAIPNPKVGLAAFNGNGSGNEASFDFFRVGSEIPLSAAASATPTSGQAPLTVNFTGKAAGGEGPYTYNWDFGDGAEANAQATSAEQNPTHTYTKAGTYTATLTTTDAAGNTATNSVQIRVTAPCDTPAAPEEGYRSLFDGTARSLQGWQMSGPGGFEHDGCTIKSVGGLGLYWFTNGGEEFKAPYTLRMQWKKDNDSNSGVFVGFPDPGNDPFNAVREGEEIQIDDSDNPAQTTGAVYLEQAPDEAARASVYDGNASNGQWQDYEIRVQTDRVQVFLNGVKINEWVDDDPAVDLASGFLGLQNHGFSGSTPDEVYFRNVRIKEEAPNPCAGQFTTPDDQFDGTSLDKCRWNSIVAEDATKYSVANGQLNLTTTPGEIYQAGTGKSNLIFQSANHAGGDYALETKVDASKLDGGYSQGGIMVHKDDNNYVKLAAISDDGNTRPTRLEMRSEVNGTVAGGPDVQLTAEQASAPIWLRVKKTGNSYAGEYSFDGQTWQAMSAAVSNAMTNPRFGLYAAGVLQGGDTVSFDYFTVDGPDTAPNTPPTVAASADPTTGSAPLPVNFTANATDPDEGDTLTYEWDFGVEGTTDDTSTQANPSYTYAAPGTYTATVTVTDAAGETGTATVQVTVTQAPNGVPTVTAAAQPTGGNAPLVVRFSANGEDPDGDDLTYAWDFGDGGEANAQATSAEQNPTHTYAEPGTYTATVTVSDGRGGEATDTVRVTVSEAPPTNVAPDTAILGGPNGVTKARAATFRLSSNEPDVVFECSMDGSPFARCSSPATFRNLADGDHVLRVRALDSEGARDASPAVRRWEVDATKPVVRGLSPRDGSTVSDRTPTVQAVARDAHDELSKADLELYVDGRRVPASGFSYDRDSNRLRYRPERNVSYGAHVVRVVAEDEAGNRTVESWRFRVVRR